MRALRKAHPETALADRSARIVERLRAHTALAAAQSVALFWPLTGEVDLRALDAAVRDMGKRVYYPVLDRSDGRVFSALALSSAASDLAPRGSRFFEPPSEAPRAVTGELDLIVVPALAVSATGHRLGYGMGFYDSLLPEFAPPAKTLIVAYEFQLLAELPLEPHDVPCDFVVTDARSLEVDKRARPPDALT